MNSVPEVSAVVDRTARACESFNDSLTLLCWEVFREMKLSEHLLRMTVSSSGVRPVGSGMEGVLAAGPSQLPSISTSTFSSSSCDRDRERDRDRLPENRQKIE